MAPLTSPHKNDLIRPAPTEYKSLALNALVGQLREDRKYNILDLGPAFGANVAFLSQFACKLHIADLYQSLTSTPLLPKQDDVLPQPDFERLLPYQKGTRFDIILAWDLLNYIQGNHIESLAHHLAGFCHTRTLMLTFISTQKQIPDEPTKFRIVDQQHLSYEVCTAAMRHCPRYNSLELKKRVPGFTINSSFLLKNGMQEYLLGIE